MRSKKKMVALIVCLIFTFGFSSVAFASGHHHGNSQANYATCTVGDCTNTANHNHSGVTYAGHYNGDGHTHHSESKHRSGCHR